MININSIRLGNYVHHNPSIWSYRNDDGVISNYGDELLEDCFQWEESDWQALNESTLFIEAINPIKITEDLLTKKCGWVMTDSNSAGKIFNYIKETGFIDEDLTIIYFAKENKFMRRNKEIKYLHKLQNLFYEIKDEELNIV